MKAEEQRLKTRVTAEEAARTLGRLSRRGEKGERLEGWRFWEEDREGEERLHFRVEERAETAAEEEVVVVAGGNLGREVKEEGRVVGLRR